MNRQIDSLALRYAGFALLFVLLAVALYLARGALPIFLFAGLVAYALDPLLERMEKRGRSRRAAVGFVFVSYLGVVAVLLSLLAAAFQQSQLALTNADVYNRQVLRLIQDNRQKLNDSRLPQPVKASLNEAIDDNLQRFNQRIARAVPDIATATVTGIGTFLFTLFLVTIVSFGFMLEAARIKTRTLMLVPPAYRRDATEISESINELLGRYVRGQAIVCLTFGTLCTLAFEAISRFYGMQYPLVLGIGAIFLYILPYFGLLTIILTAALTAYLTSTQPIPATVATVLSCVVINIVVDYGVLPRVLGKGVGLHPLMVIFAILVGWELGGPLGTLVAVPIFASARVIFVYLFPQIAAPIPPGLAERVGEDETSEIVHETAVVEHLVQQPPEVEALEEKLNAT